MDETSSTSILQAMSIGLPIIASNVGGNKMLLKTYKKRNILLVDNDKNKIFHLLKVCILKKIKSENYLCLRGKQLLNIFQIL